MNPSTGASQFEPPTNEQPSVPHFPAQSQHPSSQIAGRQPWKCFMCSYMNDPVLSVCARCGSAPYKVVLERAPLSSFWPFHLSPLRSQQRSAAYPGTIQQQNLLRPPTPTMQPTLSPSAQQQRIQRLSGDSSPSIKPSAPPASPSVSPARYPPLAEVKDASTRRTQSCDTGSPSSSYSSSSRIRTPSSPKHQSQSSVSSPKVGPKEWECKFCTFCNVPVAVACAVCGHAANSAPPPVSGQWACPICTLINSANLTECSMCGKAKPLSKVRHHLVTLCLLLTAASVCMFQGLLFFLFFFCASPLFTAFPFTVPTWMFLLLLLLSPVPSKHVFCFSL